MATAAIEEHEGGSLPEYRDQPLVEPINPTKLVDYFNDVVGSLLEDPQVDLLKSADFSDSLMSQTSTSNSAALLKICTAFASDSSPAVLFILRDSINVSESNQDDQTDLSRVAGMFFFIQKQIQPISNI